MTDSKFLAKDPVKREQFYTRNVGAVKRILGEIVDNAESNIGEGVTGTYSTRHFVDAVALVLKDWEEKGELNRELLIKALEIGCGPEIYPNPKVKKLHTFCEVCLEGYMRDNSNYHFVELWFEITYAIHAYENTMSEHLKEHLSAHFHEYYGKVIPAIEAYEVSGKVDMNELCEISKEHIEKRDVNFKLARLVHEFCMKKSKGYESWYQKLTESGFDHMLETSVSTNPLA